MPVVWVCVSGLSLTSFVALRILSSFSAGHFAHLQNGQKAARAPGWGEDGREAASGPWHGAYSEFSWA